MKINSRSVMGWAFLSIVLVSTALVSCGDSKSASAAKAAKGIFSSGTSSSSFRAAMVQVRKDAYAKAQEAHAYLRGEPVSRSTCTFNSTSSTLFDMSCTLVSETYACDGNTYVLSDGTLSAQLGISDS